MEASATRGTAGDPLGLVETILERRYRVDRLVAEGGFGIVYQAHHLALGVPVALKDAAKVGARVLLADAVLGQAHGHLDAGRLDQAEALFLRARAAYVEVDSGAILRCDAALAEIARSRGDLDRAIALGKTYDPTATQTAAIVELLALDDTQTRGVYSYLSRDSSGNLYFTAESTDVYVEKIAACP